MAQVIVWAGLSTACGLTLIVLWHQRREARRRMPMPALQRQVPGLPKDGEPLTHRELVRLLGIASGLAAGQEAGDPMEQPGCYCGHAVHPDKPCDQGGCGCQVSRPKAAA